MPLFYFHLLVGKQRYPDDMGIEFDSLEAAYLNAFEGMREMWVELLKEGDDPTTRSFEISDSDGKILLIVPFTEVLEAARKPAPRSLTVTASINLIELTQTLTAALNQQIQDTRTIIDISKQTVNRVSGKKRFF